MVYRIDVGARPASLEDGTCRDPHAQGVAVQARELGYDTGRVESWRVFYLDTPSELTAEQIDGLCRELLADPIVEHARRVTTAPTVDGGSWVEVHLRPGVMDPVAASTEMAIRDMGLAVNRVRTGRAYRFQRRLPASELREIARRVLANEVIETIHLEAVLTEGFPALQPYRLKRRHVSIRDLDDAALQKLSRDGHLFLSLDEMRAVQAHYRRLEREPTDVELETIAQTWSEHCVHKTLKSAVEVMDESGQVLRRYGNLIKETIFRATAELVGGQQSAAGGTATGAPSVADFCLSVFKDNAGVIAFDETDAVCFKVETHNHPSAIEPYGGAATGIGGVIRDILGTGLGARPIANTDVFCVAFPVDRHGPWAVGSDSDRRLPKGVIHPKRVLQRMVAGVRDYGNRMGIPTVNGAVYFDDRYIGNPLVFCGCVGILPRGKIDKAARAGDAIVLIGGRTGRDGIHGATFSSAELTDTHADEFSHAVQIGNAITEKQVADVVIAARDRGLFTAITDCGAGGLSSAVGEMGADLGAVVELETVPLKYQGLRYDEIWISEAQERMVLSVPSEKVDDLLALCRSEDVEATVIGRFGTERRELILRYEGEEVGRMAMDFIHDGIPMPHRRAVVREGGAGVSPAREQRGQDARATLLSLLSHPNIASKHWIIRQYDHEVQSGSVIKPLVGPLQRGPSDAAVIRPKLDSFKGVAIACGLAPHIEDPYAMALASIDEAVRNAVAVGADVSKLAMLDNFCWPSCDDERAMGALVRACEACYDAAKAYGIPFISGKDSLHNQFTNSETGEVIRIPYTLLISVIGVIDDVRRCVSMDLKSTGNSLYLLRPRKPDLSTLPRTHRLVASAIALGLVRSAHDVSDGGWLVAAAEMCIASGLGLALRDTREREAGWMFEESPGGYILELPRARFAEAHDLLSGDDAIECVALGEVVDQPRLAVSNLQGPVLDEPLEALAQAWMGTLDW